LDFYDTSVTKGAMEGHPFFTERPKGRKKKAKGGTYKSNSGQLD